MRLIRFKWLNLIKQVNRKLINGINWKTPKYEEIIGRRISPLHAGNTFCCIYVHLYISYANLFLCFYNMIWDIIFRTTFKVIWYRAWSNWARTHYVGIWLACSGTLGPYIRLVQQYKVLIDAALVLFRHLSLHAWGHESSFPCRARIAILLSDRWIKQTCPEHYFGYFHFCDGV